MRSRGLFAVAAILSLASIGRAQSGGGGEPIQLYETYARQDVREDLTPYGVDLLGEQFDLATGTLSFSHIDISIPGNSGLEVAVRRSLNTAMDLFRPSVNEFADWQLEVPRMEMMVAASDGWHLDRCTSASEPDPVFKLGTTFFPFDFWNGLKMIIPGQGSQTVLDSPASPKQPNTQKTTTDYWIISCISDIGGGQGEGFVATSPDGIEYTFDRLRYRTAPPVIKGVALDRNRAQMLATRVEDRFGNWVEYDYSSSGLTISSNDGRTIALTYVPGTQRIGTVTAGGRTWTYGYTIYTGYSYHFLTSVTLPSGQSWSLDLHELVTTPILKELKLHCGIPSNTATGTITHPYGATGTYTIEQTAHGRTDVPELIILNPGEGNCSGEGYYIQRSYDVMSLTQKKLQGPGLPTMTWNYSYSENQGGWQGDGTNPLKTTTVSKPDDSWDVYHFNRSWSYLENALIKQESYNPNGTLAQEVDYTYEAGPIRGGVGELLYENLSPMRVPRRQKKVTVTRGPDEFYTEKTYNQGAFSFGHPTTIQQWNNLGGGHAQTKVIAYQHDLSSWELALPTTVEVNSETVSETIYDSENRPEYLKRYGVTVSRLAYNSAGQLIWERQLNDASYQTSFDDYYRGMPRTITFADSKTGTLSIDYFGNITAATDRAGNTTTYAYDDMDRLTLINYPDESGSTRANKTLSYDTVTSTDINQPGSGLVSNQWKQTKTRGSYRETRYLDALLRPVLVKTEDTSDGNLTRFSRTTYDSRSQPVFQSFASATAAASDGTETAYDGLGRVEKMEETVSPYATTTYAYPSGNRIQVTNPRGKSTTTTYFALGAPDSSLPTLIQQPEGVTTTIARNDFGEMTSVTQSGGGVSAIRSYRYDSRHNLCRQIDPETGSTVYSYDDTGRLEWYAQAAAGGTGACNLSSVPASQRVVHSYDNLNQLTLVDYPDASPDVTYGYDNGNLTTLNSSSANRTYSYNKLNALKSESLATGGQTFNVSYQFDTQDRLTKITYPTGLQVPITPNAYGTPASVGSYASSIGYHENGSIETLTYGNGWVYSKSRNARQLPYDLTLMSGGTTISQLRHLYDPNANITAITDYVTPAATRGMGYDDLDRLGTASGLWGSGSYTYDALGNITSKTEGGRTMTYHYDTNNRLTSITGASPMTYGTQDFSYNRAGNMVSSTNPSITYRYDGHQRRVQRTEGGQTTYTMYSQSGQLLHKQAGGVTTDYIYAGSLLIATRQGSTINYVHTDLLGSPINGTAGATGYTESYTPWGEKLDNPIPLAGDVGYTGHQSDVATGLTYMQARYYDPVVGRFLAVDPIGFVSEMPNTFNRYSYVNNNPFRYTDPSGMVAQNSNFWGEAEEVEEIVVIAAPRAPGNSLSRSFWQFLLGTGPRQPFARVYDGDTGEFVDVYINSSGGSLEYVLGAGRAKQATKALAKLWSKYGNKLPARLRSMLGYPKPSFVNRGGRLQPRDPGTGMFLPYSKNPGLQASSAAQFSRGFSQGFVEAQTHTIGPVPPGGAASVGHAIGLALGQIWNIIPK